MAEDLMARLAQLKAAKEERTNKEDEEKRDVEIGEAKVEAEQEDSLRDKAKALEAKVAGAEEGAAEAEEAIKAADSMLAQGDPDPEYSAAIETIKEDARKIIAELQATKAELAGINEEILKLNTKPGEPAAQADQATAQELDGVPAADEAKSDEVSEQSFRAKKEEFFAEVDEILEKMPDLNKANSYLEASDAVADVLKEFDNLIGRVVGGGEVLDELYEKMGPSVLEFVKQLASMRERSSDSAWQKRDRQTYKLEGVKALSDFGNKMDDHNPEAGAECAAFVLAEYVKKFRGMPAEKIRKGLYTAIDSKALRRSFEIVVKRLGRGEDLPQPLKETVKDILPILEASDSVKDEANDTSRFLTDRFLSRNQQTQGESAKYAENIRNALNGLRQS